MGSAILLNQLMMNHFYRTQPKNKRRPNDELLKSYFFKKNVLTKMRAIALSSMALTVFLCGSCDLLDELQPDEFEPNNSRSEAYPIEQGEIYNAKIAENDADFWKP